MTGHQVTALLLACLLVASSVAPVAAFPAPAGDDGRLPAGETGEGSSSAGWAFVVGDGQPVNGDQGANEGEANEVVLNGMPRIVLVFVQNGKVTTSFVPTHPNHPGPIGYSHEIAKHYIKQQTMEKYKEINEIVEEYDEGERAKDPGRYPTP